MPLQVLRPGEHWFPHPLTADPAGYLAIFGDLDPQRLLTAYRFGIFPWYARMEPVIWWFPDPRCVLFPDDLRVTKSMRSVLRNGGFDVSFNTDFGAVIEACGNVHRPGQEGTWLHPEMMKAYVALHKMGYAHSVEVRRDGELVGGLYGIALGRIFFGESMFATVSNASKVGFITLVRTLKKMHFSLIDCQQDTPHLRSLGAITIDADSFLTHLRTNHRHCLRSEKISFG